MKVQTKEHPRVSSPNMEKMNVGIIGARGYSGMELCRLLRRHPKINHLTAFTQTSDSNTLLNFNLDINLDPHSPKPYCPIEVRALSDFLNHTNSIYKVDQGATVGDEKADSPQESGQGYRLGNDEMRSKRNWYNPSVPAPSETKEEECISRLSVAYDLIFLATPAEVSLGLAPKVLPQASVIDLSGAFRLPRADYPQWYGFTHSHPELLAKARFGLSPWLEIPKIAPHQQNQLIANPGCYATAVLMGLIPLLKGKSLIHPDSLAIDAKSGTTGAGKKTTENLLFSEVEGNCTPYRVGRHQHLPEIRYYIENTTGVTVNPFFSTSLLPVRRGIIVSIFANLKTGVSSEEVTHALTKAYANNPLVQVGQCSDRQNAQLLSLRKVVGTARTHICFEVVDKKLYLFVCIDNLLKGAASQAVENLNRMAGWDTALGLTSLEGVSI